MTANSSISAAIVTSTENVNPAMLNFFLVLNGLICAQLIGVLGIVGNILSIINFYRQGLGDSVIITLTSISISDCGALVFLQIACFFNNPWMPRFGLPYITASCAFQTHGYFMRLSGLLTAFASFERCLCVVLPLKVKTIFTANIAKGSVVFLFLAMYLYSLPLLMGTYVDWRFIPQLNRSILYLYYRDNGEAILQVSYYITDLFIPNITIIIIIACTAVTVIKLKSKARWRNKVSRQAVRDGKSAVKERKTVVMLVVISIIFVVCLIPHSAILTTVGVVREMKTGGAKFDITLLCYCFTLLLEAINCSVNILVYYRMSSRYKEELHKLLPCYLKTGHVKEKTQCK